MPVRICWFVAGYCTLVVFLVRRSIAICPPVEPRSRQKISLGTLADRNLCSSLLTLLQHESCHDLRSPIKPASTTDRASLGQVVSHAKDPISANLRRNSGHPGVKSDGQHGPLDVSLDCCTVATMWTRLGCKAIQTPANSAVSQTLQKQAVQCGPLNFRSSDDSHRILDSLFQWHEVGSNPLVALQVHHQMQQELNWQQQLAPGQPHLNDAFVEGSFSADAAASWYPNGGAAEPAAEHVKLFVAVITLAANKRERDAIRATWGADPRLQRVVFVAAQPRDTTAFDALRMEAVAHHDLVVVPNVLEHYDNITHQTLEACRIAATDLVATHFLKVDDDSFMRVGPLLNYVARTPPSWAFTGYIENPGGRPHRVQNIADKWYVSEQDWPTEHYPPWAHGPGYTLTMDLVKEIAAGAAVTASPNGLFKLEDIAMGSWVDLVSRERGVKVNLISNTHFNYSGCKCGDLISHYFTAVLTYCVFAEKSCCCDLRQNQIYESQFEKVGYNATLMKGWKADTSNHNVIPRHRSDFSHRKYV